MTHAFSGAIALTVNRCLASKEKIKRWNWQRFWYFAWHRFVGGVLCYPRKHLNFRTLLMFDFFLQFQTMTMTNFLMELLSWFPKYGLYCYFTINFCWLVFCFFFFKYVHQLYSVQITLKSLSNVKQNSPLCTLFLQKMHPKPRWCGRKEENMYQTGFVERQIVI